MAKKKTSKPKSATEGQGATTLLTLGEALPPDVFPDPASLPKASVPPPPSIAASHENLVPFGATRPRSTAAAPRSTTARSVAQGRAHNPTFDAPPAAVAQARAMANNLRAVLGNAMHSLQHAVAEIEMVQAHLAEHPDSVREFERLDISPAEAERFRLEAMDVIEAFKPMEGI